MNGVGIAVEMEIGGQERERDLQQLTGRRGSGSGRGREEERTWTWKKKKKTERGGGQEKLAIISPECVSVSLAISSHQPWSTANLCFFPFSSTATRRVHLGTGT